MLIDLDETDFESLTAFLARSEHDVREELETLLPRKECASAQEHLRQFSRCMCNAIMHRLEGHIDRALREEAEGQKHYLALPTVLRW
jgi:endonuclease III